MSGPREAGSEPSSCHLAVLRGLWTQLGSPACKEVTGEGDRIWAMLQPVFLPAVTGQG